MTKANKCVGFNSREFLKRVAKIRKETKADEKLEKYIRDYCEPRVDCIKMPICCFCNKPYDISKDNYGWHLRGGLFERCIFPLQIVSRVERVVKNK